MKQSQMSLTNAIDPMIKNMGTNKSGAFSWHKAVVFNCDLCKAFFISTSIDTLDDDWGETDAKITIQDLSRVHICKKQSDESKGVENVGIRT